MCVDVDKKLKIHVIENQIEPFILFVGIIAYVFYLNLHPTPVACTTSNRL